MPNLVCVNQCPCAQSQKSKGSLLKGLWYARVMGRLPPPSKGCDALASRLTSLQSQFRNTDANIAAHDKISAIGLILANQVDRTGAAVLEELAAVVNTLVTDLAPVDVPLAVGVEAPAARTEPRAGVREPPTAATVVASNEALVNRLDSALDCLQIILPKLAEVDDHLKVVAQQGKAWDQSVTTGDH